MIKATKLRIGNHVLYKPYGNRDGEPVTIAGMLGMKAYFNKHSNESGMFHNLEPIPLTPEILEKCGFEVKDQSFTGGDGKRHQVLFYLSPFFGDFKQNRLQCRFYDDRDPLWWLVAEVGPTPTGLTSLTRLPYLHQIQNLFYALTGQELNCQV